ncbi:MAG: hypothetical protein R2731_04685 [Nocardioides sp.]
MTTVYVPGDAAACSVGADDVAAALAAAGADVRRNGSRGLLWAEPLVEVVTEAGRVGYANVTADQAADLLAGQVPPSSGSDWWRSTPGWRASNA